MKVSEFTHLLQYPKEMVTASQTRQLDDVLQAYPYFQTARALQLKGLNNLNSFKYNDSLKVTAAYTADRDVLFDFITSEEFLQNSIADTISGKTAPITEQETVSEDVMPNPDADTDMIEESKDEPLPRSLKDADQILDPSLFKSKDPEVDKKLAKEKRQKAEADLEMGKPLPFTKKEKHSFGEWLQLTSLKSVSREENSSDETETIAEINFPLEDESTKKQKFDLIDKFIESDPSQQTSKLQTNNRVETINRTAELLGTTTDKITDSNGNLTLTITQKTTLSIISTQNQLKALLRPLIFCIYFPYSRLYISPSGEFIC